MADEPDPNAFALSLPWAQDLRLDNNGSLIFVSGPEKIREEIIRFFFTGALGVNSAGEYQAPEYLMHPDYGLGAGRLVGDKPTPEVAAKLKRLVRNAVKVSEGVDITKEPEIELFVAPGGTIWIKAQVFLLDNTTLQLNFPFDGKNSV